MNWLIKTKLLLSLFLVVQISLFVLSCVNTKNTAINGFDHMCEIYTNIMQNPQNIKMSLGDKIDKISSEIELSVKSDSAKLAFRGYMRASPTKRYSVLKKIAEYELNRSWDCAILRDWERDNNAPALN